MPINQLYDIAVEEPDSMYGKCIHASESGFAKVAGMLHMLATSKPDSSMTDELGRELIIDHDTQAIFFSFAMQCFSATLCVIGDDTDMKLRQKPDDPCVLQQLQDESWVDVFDYAACLMPSLEEALQNASDTETEKDLITGAPSAMNDLWQEFQDNYTGTSESFDPALVMSGVDAGFNRAGLCKAVGIAVRRYVSQSLKLKTETTEGLNRAVLAIGVGVAILALLVAFPALLAALPGLIGSYLTIGNLGIAGAVLGLNAIGLQVWAQSIKDTDISVLNDPAAIADIVCIWYSNMKDETDISAEKFAEELDVSGESANTQALYAIIKNLIEQPIAYPAFLKLWKAEINLKTMGIEEAFCECDAPDVVLSQVPGFVNLVTYEGKDGASDVYSMTSYFNGYSNAISVGSNIAFDMVSLEFLEGSHADIGTYQVSSWGGTFYYYTAPFPWSGGNENIGSFTPILNTNTEVIVVRVKVIPHV